MTDFGSDHTSQVFKAEAQAQSLPSTFLKAFLASKIFLRLFLPSEKCRNKTQDLDVHVTQLSMDLHTTGTGNQPKTIVLVTNPWAHFDKKCKSLFYFIFKEL